MTAEYSAAVLPGKLSVNVHFESQSAGQHNSPNAQFEIPAGSLVPEFGSVTSGEAIRGIDESNAYWSIAFFSFESSTPVCCLI